MRATFPLYTRTNAQYKKIAKDKAGKLQVPADYRGLFYVRMWQSEKRTWVPFRTVEEALAKQANEFINQQKGIASEPAPTSIISLSSASSSSGSIVAAAAEYLREQESRAQDWRNGSAGGLSPHGSLPVIQNAIDTFLRACKDFGANDMSELKDPARGRQIMLAVKKWMEANTVRRKGKAAYTDAKKFAYIAQLLAHNGIKMAKDKKVRWDGDPGLLKWNEVPRAKKPKVSDVVFYTPADLRAMWDAADTIVPAKNGPSRRSYTTDDYRDLLVMLTLTGMRDEEVQHLQWDDIIWANGDGLPKFKVQDKPQYDWKPKNGERTVQPIEHFAIALRERLKARKTRLKVINDKTLIFPTTLDTPDQNFADRVRDMQDRALKAEYQFNRPEAYQANIVHNFRRTFATTLNSCYGLSAPTVQDRIGDADLETVQRYLGKVDDPHVMREEFEALPFGKKAGRR